MLRFLCALFVGTVLSWFAFMVVTGSGGGDGPVLFSFLPGRGIHRGDLFVVGGWLVSMVALVVLSERPRRGPSGGPRRRTGTRGSS